LRALLLHWLLSLAVVRVARAFAHVFSPSV
jgi:hypothetical protein